MQEKQPTNYAILQPLSFYFLSVFYGAGIVAQW